MILSGDNELTSGAIAFGCGMLDNLDLMYCDLHVDPKGKKHVTVNSRDSLSDNREVIGRMGLYRYSEGSTQEVQEASDDEWIKEFMFSVDDSKPGMYGMTGRLFEELFMKRNIRTLQPVFEKTILFSRMLPKHKVGLFQNYQNIGRVCAFVG